MAWRSHRTLQLKGRDSSPRDPPVEGTAAQWTASVELASEAAVRQESRAESRALKALKVNKQTNKQKQKKHKLAKTRQEET